MKKIRPPLVPHYVKPILNHSTELLFSLVFTAILTAGYYLSRYPAIDATPLDSSIVFAGLIGALVVWCILFFIFISFKKHLLRKPVPVNNSVFLKHISDRKLWLLLSAIIFALYIPIILLSHSMLSPDSWSSLAQITGEKPLNNANPLIFTMFVGLFVSIGLFVSDLELGTLFFSLAQSAIMAVIFAKVLVWMRQMKVGVVGLVSAFIFYAILPVNSFAGHVMWKDILFAGFGLVFLMLLRQLYLEKNKFFTPNKVSLFILFGFLFCVWRTNGIYAYELFVLLAVIVNYKAFFSRRYLFILIAPAAIALLYLNLLPTPPSSGVKIVVPLQQIARTVKLHSNSIPLEETKVIKDVLQYDQIANKYNPDLSDPVIGLLNGGAYKKNESRFMNTWVRMSDDYTKTYVAAFAYNSYGYVYPFYTSPSPTDILMDNDIHLNALEGYVDTAYDDGGKYTAIEYRDFVMKPVSILHNIGFYTCAILFTTYIAVVRRRRELIGVYLLLFCLFISTILGPVNGEFRYLYLFVIATPFVISAAYSTNVVKRVRNK